MSGSAAAQFDRTATHGPGRVRLLGPYLLFLGDTSEPGFAKTAFGLRDWARDQCLGELALPDCTVTTGLPRLTTVTAHEQGARALLIGVAAPGGLIPPSWMPTLVEALEAGLDIISGLHTRLAEQPQLRSVADRLGRRLIDIRVPPPNIAIATGQRRTGRRLLTVGTDCALGKKYTALAIARGLQARGVDAQFRATGQTGIMIAGSGVPIDAVVADFVAGAAEMLTPAALAHHMDIIEGQGSLFHPAYAAVSLGLLHGSQPDSFVVCHEPGRATLLGYPDFQMPRIADVITQTIALGRLTNPAIRCAAISLNTAHMDDESAQREILETSQQLGYPTADPVRGGQAFERLLDACLE